MKDGKRQKTLKNEIIWLWCADISSKTIAWTVGCSRSTVVDWSNFLREVCTEKLNVAPQMGGTEEVVQIDEALFRDKLKYNRGRLLLGNQNNNNNTTNGLITNLTHENRKNSSRWLSWAPSDRRPKIKMSKKGTAMTYVPDQTSKLFLNLISNCLRMNGNGYPLPSSITQMVTEYIRLEIRTIYLNYFSCQSSNYLSKSLFGNLLYLLRHNQTRLKRLRQYIRIKVQSKHLTEQNETTTTNMTTTSKWSIYERFNNLCGTLAINIEEKQTNDNICINDVDGNMECIDKQRYRQFSRFDCYCKTLNEKEYLELIETQHRLFARLHYCSDKNILNWLQIPLEKYASKSSTTVLSNDLHLSEMIIFMLKEIVLDLADDCLVKRTLTNQNDQKAIQYIEMKNIFRRKQLKQHLRLPYTGRRVDAGIKQTIFCSSAG
ncbi:unnamed protein product [Didymodactylos carnosus]|uniref:Uncharacterized protein n=1 Tax=Didymodactylos carnosus TaxID=1234261 RepID=A0A814AJN0_9BILA|nr:unnamed protein product [Didymodactylos carnosus]CAF0913085.1 unnamed protein product [Didymodactylos carnosus]CAF3536445.1 unnamed protein product [Didymodactylos carnosus]CAF3693765.1 unnamed protein product [Didymodactylos carnosus]